MNTWLGKFKVNGHIISVQHPCEESLWLETIQANSIRDALGTIRWNAGSTPTLHLAPSQVHWLMPHSELAESVVRLSMALYRHKVLHHPLPDNFPGVSDVHRPSPLPCGHPARGVVALVPD